MLEAKHLQEHINCVSSYHICMGAFKITLSKENSRLKPTKYCYRQNLHCISAMHILIAYLCCISLLHTFILPFIIVFVYCAYSLHICKRRKKREERRGERVVGRCLVVLGVSWVKFDKNKKETTNFSPCQLPSVSGRRAGF